MLFNSVYFLNWRVSSPDCSFEIVSELSEGCGSRSLQLVNGAIQLA